MLSAPSTPRVSTRALTLLALLLLPACPRPDSLDPDAASGGTGEPATTGTSAPDPCATVTPTTGSPTEDPGTTTGTTGTSGDTEPVSTDSSGSSTGETTGPDFGQCPFDPAGVEVALERVEQDVASDLSVRPCGDVKTFTGLSVVAAADDQLEAQVCADATCGACDPADLVRLTLEIPDGFAGLPAEVGAGDCVQLAIGWDRPVDPPDLCAVAGLTVIHNTRGAPDPVPTFLYRYSESLPALDDAGPFSLTGASAGPGAIGCRCDGDCCAGQPGSHKVRFTAKLWQAEIENPPVESGETIQAFAFGTPEGDDLMGSISLVRASVPGTCDVPSRFEWLLRVVSE